MRILVHEQGSPEWLLARLGCPSGSGFSKLVTTSGKPSTTAETYINELIAEKVIGQIPENNPNEWMQRGTALEPDARAFYEFDRDVEVTEVGFCMHDTLECGISPDGLVGDDGGLEIKCPKPSTHIKYLRNQAGYLQKKKPPTEYYQQVMGCLWITEREWWDFLSYHPSLPPMLVRVERDEEYIKLLAAEVEKACEIIENQVQYIRSII